MRRFSWLCIALVAALISSACSSSGGGGQTDGQKESSTLRVTRVGPIFPVFHPVRATDNTYPLLYLIYSNLVHLAPGERTITPDLATSWKASDDATTFTFTLADNVTWQDGTKFTADDVAFTAWWAARYPNAISGLPAVWSQIKGADETAKSGADLAGVKVLSDTSIEFTLSAPNAEFLPSLANASNVIVPKHIFKDETDKTIEKITATTQSPIGTGPYKLTKYVPDQYVELTANADYFKGAPKISRIIWKILPAEQVTTQLQSGELDAALGLGQENRQTLESVKGLKLVDSTSVGMIGLYTRTDAPALSDKRVRQALYYGIDRRALIAGVLKGAAKPLWNPPGLNFDDLNQYPFDQAKAKSLLQDAGWKAGTTLRLVYWKEAPNATEVLPIIQQQLGEIGVKVDLNPLEIDDWDDMVTNPDRRGQWDLDYEFGGSFGLSPDQSARSYGNCTGPKVQTGYQNCALADLFVQGRATTDQGARDTAYHKAAEMINDAADAIYLWQPVLLNPISDKLKNFEIYPFDRHSFMRANEWSMQ